MVTIKTVDITGTSGDVSSVTDIYQTVKYTEDFDVHNIKHETAA